MEQLPEYHRRAVEAFGRQVHAVKDDQWHDRTPCADWDVRELVRHLVYESVWTAPIFEGRTIAEVGDRFEGDLLGDDPIGAWDASAGPAVDAVQGEGAMGRIVHLSFGDVPGEEYASQLFADYLIHSWDLATAIGADDALDGELVEACTAWFTGREALYRAGGAIADRPPIPEDADPQTRLLAMFGRAR